MSDATSIKGKFIVLEGIDGCGKSTQASKLVNRLRHDGKNAMMATGPSDGPIGKLIRSNFLSGKRRSDFRTIQALYLADRLDMLTNTESGIVSLLNSGVTVVCDRFYMSSVVYYAQEFLEDPVKYEVAKCLMYTWNEIYEGLVKPDVTIFIDITPEIATKRCGRSAKHAEIYDTNATISRVHKVYQDVISYYGERENIVTIDGNMKSGDLHDAIYDIINNLPVSGRRSSR